jgi:hypothetical protein
MDAEEQYEAKKREYDEIMAVADPAEKHRLLEAWEKENPEGFVNEEPFHTDGFVDQVLHKWDTDSEFRRTVTRTYITVAVGGYVIYRLVTRPEKGIYSYGPNHPVKIRATDKEVERFNKILDVFYEAQQKLLDKGTPWDGKSVIRLKAKKADKKTFRAVGKRWEKSLKKFSSEGKTMAYFLDEMHLVKND